MDVPNHFILDNHKKYYARKNYKRQQADKPLICRDVCQAQAERAGGRMEARQGRDEAVTRRLGS